jgi:2-dehydropantoate 2-reductase
MRLLIYGAGVIGCWYAVLFSKAGYDTTIYARGKRLELLRKEGLRYEVKGKVHKADIKIIGRLENEDSYDFIFLTVKENQVHTALEELSHNSSPNIVTMVNTIEGYENWERLSGEGRIIPAFPGAGGSFQDGILKAALTPYIIQPTTFAEINGCRTERLDKLSKIFKSSRVPYQIVKNMQDWQLCHLAMVVPIADAYYMARIPQKAWKEDNVMQKTAVQMKHNFQTLYKMGIVLSPRKMNMFRLLPTWMLKTGLTLVFKSDFGDVFMYQHSMNAPDEMRALHEQFYGYLNDK